MIFFVSGNDTNIGKTFVSSLLIKLLKSKYEKVAYIKPIESGIKNLKNSVPTFNPASKSIEEASRPPCDSSIALNEYEQ